MQASQGHPPGPLLELRKPPSDGPTGQPFLGPFTLLEGLFLTTVSPQHPHAPTPNKGVVPDTQTHSRGGSLERKACIWIHRR